MYSRRKVGGLRRNPLVLPRLYAPHAREGEGERQVHALA